MNKIGDDYNHGKFGYHLRTLSKFVELEPTTRKYRLTDRGKLLADVIHDFRFLTSRGTEASRYAERLTIGDHAVAFYDNDNFKRQISFPFLKAGLSRGEAGVYIVSEDKLDSEIREMQEYGIDFDSLPKEAFTIMSAHEWYLRKGRARAKTIATNWQTLVHEKKRAGFAGVHAAGEAAVLISNGKSEELLRYDKSLGRQLASDLCGLCLYDKNVLEERYLAQVFHCHSHIISKDLLGKTVA
ncbi:MEDS domain-containing protein [Candidatus Bathyarchaeota archaeon]|nr:MEDS domain-containing protein [Candidatus Bathyarchaeota archaeon]